MAKVKITLVKSLIGRPEGQRTIVNTLGLKKLNSFVLRDESPALAGMINKVAHLVKVEKA